MNKVLIAATTFLVFACKEEPKKQIKMDFSEETEQETTQNKYPENLFKVFEAHGGLDKWKAYKTLSFDIMKPEFTENQIIDLYRRTDKISTPTYSLGYDGDNVWLLDIAGTYEGKPKFYHNLMFYFYAMPYVFADAGLNYEEIPSLEVEGVTYPGYKISYNSGIGASSKDEYYLHYDADTFQMKWLGYTVTYFSKEPSDKISWVNYGDWLKVNEILLPQAITWHVVENGEIKEPAKMVDFENASLSKVARPKDFYTNPENAKLIVD
ncbi:hypothetical protein [Maribacter sp. ACAM166]|uniref:hypothetical protein n=1 Tax=Maribacter sp. ACAM166 TaxID=2508996 RepID=UPI0010FE6802|nr:hypothetical protein [Maribacter sp. ACAM166]TLP80606.1 hypothetical protein ES765_07510 [Maribacter sp. ACAM166]